MKTTKRIGTPMGADMSLNDDEHIEKNRSTLIELLPPNTLYVLVRWPFFQSFKQYAWFEHECVYYGTWDPESIIKAYFIPLARMQELHDQGDPELFLFTIIGRP